MNIEMTQEQAQQIFNSNLQLAKDADALKAEYDKVIGYVRDYEDANQYQWFVNKETVKFLHETGTLRKYLSSMLTDTLDENELKHFSSFVMECVGGNFISWNDPIVASFVKLYLPDLVDESCL